MFIHRKGQSTLEYALVIAVVVGALVLMNIYMKRGVEGKIKQSSDEIGAQFAADDTSIAKQALRSGTSVHTISQENGYTITTNELHDEEQKVSGEETVGAW